MQTTHPVTLPLREATRNKHHLQEEQPEEAAEAEAADAEVEEETTGTTEVEPATKELEHLSKETPMA